VRPSNSAPTAAADDTRITCKARPAPVFAAATILTRGSAHNEDMRSPLMPSCKTGDRKWPTAN